MSMRIVLSLAFLFFSFDGIRSDDWEFGAVLAPQGIGIPALGNLYRDDLINFAAAGPGQNDGLFRGEVAMEPLEGVQSALVAPFLRFVREPTSDRRWYVRAQATVDFRDMAGGVADWGRSLKFVSFQDPGGNEQIWPSERRVTAYERLLGEWESGTGFRWGDSSVSS